MHTARGGRTSVIKDEEYLPALTLQISITSSRITLQGAACARMHRHQARLAELAMVDMETVALEVDIFPTKCSHFRDPL